MTARRIISVVLALATLLAGCGSGGGSGDGDRSPGARPSSSAALEIVTPAPGAIVEGTTLVVKVAVTGARVLEQASRDVRPDTGHVHLSLDGRTVTLLAGLEHELTGLTPGEHLLQAEFAAADHGPFNPRVIATAAFTVR